MIQLKLTITLDNSGITAYRQWLKKLPKFAEDAFPKAVALSTAPLVDDLAQAPGSVKRPIRWATQKQKQAYFATDGFGKGIPYRRSGRLADGWDVSVESDRATIDIWLRNSVPYSGFVQGDRQQPFHKNTGWRHVDSAIFNHQETLTAALVDTWESFTELIDS